MQPTIVNNDFLEGDPIPGLGHYPQFLSPEECAALENDVAKLWKPPVKVSFGEYRVLLPGGWTDLLEDIRKRIEALQLMSGNIDRIQVNHYDLHKGITDHVDTRVIDGAGISVGSSSAVMHFRPTLDAPVTTRLLFSRGDLYFLTGKVRWYAHGILDGQEDVFKGRTIPRIGKRVAVVFAQRDLTEE